MSGSRDALRARLSRLLVEQASERSALARLRTELATYRAQLVPHADRPVMALVAVDLHDFYTALEALFERVARNLDGAVPTGSESHRELVDQMAAELPPIRGAIIDQAGRDWLHELRRFRHFFRHAYAVALDPAHLARHVDALDAGYDTLTETIDALMDQVREMRDTLA